jgi:hypothetical protein
MGTGTDAGASKPPKFDGALFHRHFETVAEVNCWAPQETFIINNRLLRLSHRRTTWSPERSDPWRNTWSLEDGLGINSLPPRVTVAKTRTQNVGESSQIFATVVQKLAHRPYPAIPENHIRTEAGKAFADGVEESTIKIQLPRTFSGS